MPIYDLERFGLRFVASPRHADVLLVTGPVTKNMREALERTYHATPDPKWVVAVGDCARDGGCFAGSYAVVGGVSEVIPVDLHIPGCPPTPTAMLQGLLALLERVDAGARCALKFDPRLRLIQAGVIAAFLQCLAILLLTPIVITFAQSRLDEQASHADPTSLNVTSLLQMIYLLIALGLAFTHNRFVIRRPHTSALLLARCTL